MHTKELRRMMQSYGNGEAAMEYVIVAKGVDGGLIIMTFPTYKDACEFFYKKVIEATQRNDVVEIAIHMISIDELQIIIDGATRCDRWIKGGQVNG